MLTVFCVCVCGWLRVCARVFIYGYRVETGSASSRASRHQLHTFLWEVWGRNIDNQSVHCAQTPSSERGCALMFRISLKDRQVAICQILCRDTCCAGGTRRQILGPGRPLALEPYFAKFSSLPCGLRRYRDPRAHATDTDL